MPCDLGTTSGRAVASRRVHSCEEATYKPLLGVYTHLGGTYRLPSLSVSLFVHLSFYLLDKAETENARSNIRPMTVSKSRPPGNFTFPLSEYDCGCVFAQPA